MKSVLLLFHIRVTAKRWKSQLWCSTDPPAISKMNYPGPCQRQELQRENNTGAYRPGLPDTTRKQTGAARTQETRAGSEREINKINTFAKAVIVCESDRGLLVVQLHKICSRVMHCGGYTGSVKWFLKNTGVTRDRCEKFWGCCKT